MRNGAKSETGLESQNLFVCWLILAVTCSVLAANGPRGMESSPPLFFFVVFSNGKKWDPHRMGMAETKFFKRSINEIIAELEINVRRRFAESFHAILGKFVFSVLRFRFAEAIFHNGSAGGGGVGRWFQG